MVVSILFLILFLAICSCDGVTQIYLINEPVANQPDLCTHENLPSISNGKVDTIRKNNLSIVEITCDIGYEYEKSSSPTNLTCVDNCEWQWQGAIPSCSPKLCDRHSVFNVIDTFRIPECKLFLMYAENNSQVNQDSTCPCLNQVPADIIANAENKWNCFVTTNDSLTLTNTWDVCNACQITVHSSSLCKEYGYQKAETKELKTRGSCSDSQPCHLCEGSCEVDTDCANEAVCYKEVTDTIPGCTGKPAKSTFYCYKPSNLRSSPSNDSQDYLTVSLSLLSVVLSGLLVLAIGAIITIRVQKLQKIKRSKRRQRDSFSHVELVGLRLPKSSTNTPRHLAIKMMCTMQNENDILLPVDSINMENKIGAGGGGQIFRGRFGTIAVALKEDFAMVIGSKFGIIAREAGILMKLRHPNIVRFYGMWRQRNERLFLVMELCQIDLEKHIQNSRANNYSELSSLRLLDYATQVSDAVQYLHGRVPAIIHRDIKPANILLDDNMRCKLSDFGLARLSSTQSTNKEVGTMAYMPPEMMTPYVLKSEMGCHVKAKQRLTKRAGMFWDVYSLGVTFCHMFTKLRPFLNLKDKQIYDEVTRSNRPKLNSFVPQPMVRLISRMWHQDPWERPTAKEVQQILSEMNTHPAILKFGRQICSVPANSSIIPKFPSVEMEAEGSRFCPSKFRIAERYRAATLPTKYRSNLKDKASKYQNLVIDVNPVYQSHQQFVRRRPCSV